MKNTILTITAFAALTGAVKAQTINYNLVADDNFQVYTGDANGANLTEVADQNFNWSVITSGSFSTSNSHIYLLTINGTGNGVVLGDFMGVDIASLPWLKSSNVATTLNLTDSDRPAVSSGTYDPSLSLVSSAIAGDSFTSPVTFLSQGDAGAPTALDGRHGYTKGLSFSGNDSAFIYKVAVTSVPEPSSTALLGLGAISLLVRRKR